VLIEMPLLRALPGVGKLFEGRLEEAALYIERNPSIVNPSPRSLTSPSQSDMEVV
jgi:hypothetical protein